MITSLLAPLLGVGAALLLAGPARPAPAAAPPASSDPWALEWLIGPPIEAPTRPAPRPSRALAARGQTLYAAACAACHGAAGDGRGPDAAKLAVPPTAFTRGVYKLRSTPAGSIPTDLDLFRTIGRGIHGTPMRPGRALREEERWALVGTLKAFSPRFREERPGPEIRVPPPPRETDALRARGQALYAQLRCAACHGEAGAADGPAAGAYRRAQPERDVRIRDFSRGRFIRGAELPDVFLTLRTGLEGTPMGAYDALADDDLWALAAHVRALVRERPLQTLPPAGPQALR